MHLILIRRVTIAVKINVAEKKGKYLELRIEKGGN